MKKCCVGVLLLSGLAWGQPELELKLRVQPSDATLLVQKKAIAPQDGVYRLSAKDFPAAAAVTPVLQAPGYADQPLPPLDRFQLRDYNPPRDWKLHPNAFRGYLREYPWVLPGFACLGLLGVAGWMAAQKKAPPPARKKVDTPRMAQQAPAGVPLYQPETQADPMMGRDVGRYRIVKRLGEGGMAVVYKALPRDDPRESEAVAIKIVRPDQMSKDFIDRFKREIRISMRLNHPNVMRIIDWGQEENQAYMVMEFVDGKPFSDMIPSNGLPLDQAMQYLPGIVEALAYAHSLGIVHRDLKPDNVMVTRNGRVKLMDFGMARNQEVNTMTVQGMAMGTPQYMAPEQVLRGPNRAGLTNKSDQYALGIMIFEVLCGTRPFEMDDDPMKLIMQHINAKPPQVRERRPDVPQEVEDVIQRMLAKDPEQRFPSVKDAGAALLMASRDYVPATEEQLAALQAIAQERESPATLEASVSLEAQLGTPTMAHDTGLGHTVAFEYPAEPGSG